VRLGLIAAARWASYTFVSSFDLRLYLVLWWLEGGWWTRLLFLPFKPFTYLIWYWSTIQPPFARDVRWNLSISMNVRLQHLGSKKNYAGSRYKYRHKKRRICSKDLKHTLRNEPFRYERRWWYDAQCEEPFFDAIQPPSSIEITPEQEKSKRFQILKDFLINYDRPTVAKSITPRQVRLYVATIGRLESLGLPVPDVEDAGIVGAHLANGPKSREIPVVIDTGCSFSLTPILCGAN